MIEGRDALDDDKFAALDEAVTQSFGRRLRSRRPAASSVGSVPARSRHGHPAAPEAPTAPPRPAPVTAAPAPARRLAPSPAPVVASAPSRHHHHRASRARAARAGAGARAREAREPVSREPAQTRESSQPAEQGTQDEAAQWWVSAWARWTSWKGTLSFAAAVKEELGKYNYVLSVPIQKSTDYEEGLLAYGYSILLEHIEHRFAGFVNKALNSLKTFQPGAAGAAEDGGRASLQRARERGAAGRSMYPEFVKSVAARRRSRARRSGPTRAFSSRPPRRGSSRIRATGSAIPSTILSG